MIRMLKIWCGVAYLQVFAQSQPAISFTFDDGVTNYHRQDI